jgi:serine/threonine protein kinase
MFLSTEGSVQGAQKISAFFGGLKSFVDLDNNGYFGRSVTAIGDLDGNGVLDLVVGAHWSGPSDSGSAYVCFLKSTSCSTGQPSLTLTNITATQTIFAPGSNGFPVLIGIASFALVFFAFFAARSASGLGFFKKERDSTTCTVNEIRARGSYETGSGIEMTGEQTIMHSVGSALVNNDTFSLVIPPEFISIRECVAVGGFGQIHKGEYGGELVAIKKIFAQLTEGLLEEFNHELRILTNLRGVPHVLLLHGVSFQVEQGQRVFIMVLEWCPISLASLLKRSGPDDDTAQALPVLAQESSSCGRTIISPRVCLAVLQQLVAALRILHYKGYVHRDLKPQNILFTNPDDLESSLRICDFGTSRITNCETGSCPMFGDLNGISPPYCPPEVIPAMVLNTGLHVDLQGRRSCSFSIDDSTYDGRAFDVYSLGIIMWECWHQQEPELTKLGNLTVSTPPSVSKRPSSAHSWAEENLQKTLDGHRPNPACANGPLGGMPSALLEIQTRLWHPDPSSRPSAAEIKTLLDSQALATAVGHTQVAWVQSPPQADFEKSSLRFTTVGSLREEVFTPMRSSLRRDMAIS